MSQTGFTAVHTRPAGAGSVSVPGLGTFAPLAGPTIAPDGTVFLGTREGKVIALRADGGEFWNRQLEGRYGIAAPPAVGGDGSVYVVGHSTHYDHRVNPPGPGGSAKLYRFTPGGGAPQNANTQFPHHRRGPTIVGAPNVWRFGTDEAVLVPAIYPTVGGYELHLLAFSPDGGVMADWSLYLDPGDVTEGGSWEALGEAIGLGGFEPGYFPPPAAVPFPGAAIATNPQGGTPAIVLIDRFNSQTIGFRFCVGASCSPAPGFIELFRTPHAPRRLLSSAVILPDWHSVVGADNGAVFSGPSAVARPPIQGLSEIYATPAVAADGRLLLVRLGGEVVALGNDNAVLSRLQLSGVTIARPAASKTHVFVATTDGLYTLDKSGGALEKHFPWVQGGIWSPAIGPRGHVYAIAANILFVFPAPPTQPFDDGRVETDGRDAVFR
jgi:outer membrane protein assembly factor BamB